MADGSPWPSVIVLAVGLALVLGSWFGLAWRLRGAHDTLAMAMIRTVNWLYCRLWFRLEAPAADPLPVDGPCLVISNHTCSIDPCLLTACTGRVISFMMAQEFFAWTGLRWLFHALQTIPVTRSGQDLAAVRGALRALREGRVVGLFPEGRIAPPEGMLPGKIGAAVIALRAGVPVVPAYIAGSPRTSDVAKAIFGGGHKRVVFGRPISPHDVPGDGADRQRQKALTDLFMQRIAALDPAGRQPNPGVADRDG